VRLLAVLAASLLGALFAIGAIIAAMLESDGFTSASAGGPRTGYLALLAGGLVASVAVPAAVATWAYPDRRAAILTAAGTSWELKGTYGDVGDTEANPTDCPALDPIFALGPVPYVAAELAAAGATATQTVRSVSAEDAAAIVDSTAEAATVCPIVRTADGDEWALLSLPLAHETGLVLEQDGATTVVIVHTVDSVVSTLEVRSESIDWTAIRALTAAIREWLLAD